jgi:hypothetical protein
MKTRNLTIFSTTTMLLATMWLLISPGFFSGCIAPVSDEAIVSVSGKVLDVDGTPMAGVTVRLVKTDLNVLDADWVIGSIANTDKTPFREIETNANGEYFVEIEGKDANAGNQLWAAYFAVYVLHPDDPVEHLGVASDSFQFSNQKLTRTVADLHFWDIPENGISVGDDSVTFTWEPTQQEPEGGIYLVHVEGTDWTEEVKGTTFSLPLSALEPCTGPVKDDPSECTAKTEHKVQLVSLADGVRYRTAWHTFTATNPKGMGLWFRNSDNTSGKTCSGKNLFDLNDGKFSGTNSVQYLDSGMSAADFRCLLIDLQQEIMLDEIFIHNGAVWFHKDARIKVLIASPDEPADSDWVELTEWDGAGFKYPNFNLHLPEVGQSARWLKIEYADVADKAFWQRIGEISVYGVPVQTP